eukprot:5689708-Pleurochrysis_carterae.AAC.1
MHTIAFLICAAVSMPLNRPSSTLNGWNAWVLLVLALLCAPITSVIGLAFEVWAVRDETNKQLRNQLCIIVVKSSLALLLGGSILIVMTRSSPQQLSDSVASQSLAGLALIIVIVVIFGVLTATALIREFSPMSVPAAASLDARLQFEARLSKSIRLESWFGKGFALNPVFKRQAKMCARARPGRASTPPPAPSRP